MRTAYFNVSDGRHSCFLSVDWILERGSTRSAQLSRDCLPFPDGRPLRTDAREFMPTPDVSLFLNSLSEDNRNSLLSQSVQMPLPVGTVLYEAQATPRYAYFITSGMASVVTAMADGATAEVGVVGREGVIGSLQIMGPALAPTRCFMQLEGSGLRISLSDLRKAFGASEEIRERILEFLQGQTMCLSQIAGCHRLHEAEQRLARWLLMVQDCTQTDLLSLTQEFLGMMLGSRRTTVSAAAGELQGAGLIEYQRGRIKILDRPRLEAVACDCYPIAKQLYAGLYSQPTRSGIK
jgi:CRP-like cAMP-binding protein